MNRSLIPLLLILLGSLLLSWFYNCKQKGTCQSCTSTCCVAGGSGMTVDSSAVSVVDTVSTVSIDTVKTAMTTEEQILFNPLDVYFETAKSSIQRNEELESFLSTAKKYLAKNASEKLILTGYTDSDGEEASNLKLSNSRAQKVKSILISEGFSEGQLTTEGKGEADPVASNDTPENKAKNRRVSIRLLK
jgi:outer membrane protein OmpA-like peptidoglycan-associated protein